MIASFQPQHYTHNYCMKSVLIMHIWLVCHSHGQYNTKGHVHHSNPYKSNPIKPLTFSSYANHCWSVLTFQVCCEESSGPTDSTPTPITPTPTPTPPISSSGESLLPTKCRVRTKRQSLADIHEIPDIHAIIIGEPVKLTEFFPWMAALGYDCECLYILILIFLICF